MRWCLGRGDWERPEDKLTEVVGAVERGRSLILGTRAFGQALEGARMLELLRLFDKAEEARCVALQHKFDDIAHSAKAASLRTGGRRLVGVGTAILGYQLIIRGLLLDIELAGSGLT